VDEAPRAPVLVDALAESPALTVPDTAVPLLLENLRNSVAETRPSLSRSRLLNWPVRSAAPGFIPDSAADEDDEVVEGVARAVVPVALPGVRSVVPVEPVEPDPCPDEEGEDASDETPLRGSVDVPAPEPGRDDDPVPELDPVVADELEWGFGGVEPVPEDDASALPEPEEEPEPELWAMIGIVARARLLEKRRKTSGRERFIIILG